MSPDDLRALHKAKNRMEHPDGIMRSVDWMTEKSGRVLGKLPKFVGKIFHKLGEWALQRALVLALTTLKNQTGKKASPQFHKFATMVTGAFGGLFGLLTLFFEIPLTTVIMLRGIADVARSEGEDLKDPETRLACLSVFAMEAPEKKDGKRQWRFFAARSMLQKLVGEAAKVAGTRGAAAKTAPAVVRLVHAIAARFGITISEKMVAQSIPIVGAVGGATINGLLTHHFLGLAKGFFTMRRLEREYGETQLRQEFEAALPANEKTA